jgi:glycosyltransferase involved in cell wall biosynthesis
MLAQRYQVTLCTAADNVPVMAEWAEKSLSPDVFANLDFLPVETPRLERHLGSIGTGLKPGFFEYDRRLARLLSGSALPPDAGLIWHYKPTSFRFRSRLSRVGLPYIVGPVGGGLPYPPELAEYFKNESLLYKLRFMDKYLLGSKFWMRPFEEAAALLISSDYMRDVLPGYLAGRAVTVLATGVDVPDQPPTREPGAGRFNVLFVGRMAKYKGPQLAVAAFARFLEAAGTPQDAYLTMVGDGRERAACETLARELGIADSVSFTGKLARAEVAHAYQNADVFLFPSITEAAGNVYLEAMREALPMVIVDSGGGRDVSCDGGAIKVPVAAADSVIDGLADGLGRLYQDRALMREMGRCGFQCVRDLYSWDALLSRVSEIVERVLDGQRLEGDSLLSYRAEERR